MKLYKDSAAITKAIASIKSRSNRLDKDIHVCAVSIVNHVNQHHEVSLVNNLVESLGKGIRSNALKAWFLEFGKCDYNAEEKCFVPRRGEAVPLEPAMETPWYEFKPEPEFQVPTTPVEMLKKSLKTNEKALDRDDLTEEQTTVIQKNIVDIKIALLALGEGVDLAAA